jgi:mannose-6-phosphate isomerase
VSEFAVHRVHSMGAPVTLALEGPLIVLTTAGVIEVWDLDSKVSLPPGRAAYVARGHSQLVVGGEGTAYVISPGRSA